MLIMAIAAPPPPRDLDAAGSWLLARHPWLKQLVSQIVPTDARREGYWLTYLANAVNVADESTHAWQAYAASTVAPDTDEAFALWQAAGPPPATAPARAYLSMSSGERSVLRLVATLGMDVAWSPRDLNLDSRGAAILSDWSRIVVGQAPYAELRAVEQRFGVDHGPMAPVVDL